MLVRRAGLTSATGAGLGERRGERRGERPAALLGERADRALGAALGLGERALGTSVGTETAGGALDIETEKARQKFELKISFACISGLVGL